MRSSRSNLSCSPSVCVRACAKAFDGYTLFMRRVKAHTTTFFSFFFWFFFLVFLIERYLQIVVGTLGGTIVPK